MHVRSADTLTLSCDVVIAGSGGNRGRGTLSIVVCKEAGASCIVVKPIDKASQLGIHVLPILKDFHFEVSQSRPLQGQPSADFGLKLAAHGSLIKVFVASLEQLQRLLGEIRRCTAASKVDADSIVHWSTYYQNEEQPLTILQSQVKSNPFINADLTQIIENTREVKEGWIAKQLRERAPSFSTLSSHRLFVGTWNVNGQPISENLTSWLATTMDDAPDLYVLGFQELDLSTEAYILTDNTKDDEWFAAIEAVLAPRGYKRVVSKKLIGMLVVIYALQPHLANIAEVATESVGTGLLGLMGNKGAVACRLRYYDSYLCFVNAHLAADTGQVERRNQDFSEICRRMTFPLPSEYDSYRDFIHVRPWVHNYYDHVSGAAFGIPPPNIRANIGIFDADHLIWLGDLNYRVNVPEVDSKKIIEEGHMLDLLKHEQLLNEMAFERAFGGFSEASITFAPTYKYDVGTSVFDTSEKRRAPSWCDRVLWHVNKLHDSAENWLKPLWYNSCMDLTISDHKPVRNIKLVELEAIREEVLRELDRFENEAQPDVLVDTNLLEFGEVRYKIPVTRSVTIQNRGKVAATFRFVARPEETRPCKPWCFISPQTVRMLPSEYVRIDITFLVSNISSAYPLNSGNEILDDLLILHTERGKDHFISCSANWLPSCFGNEIAALCQLVNPVRSYTVRDIREKLESGLSPSAEHARMSLVESPKVEAGQILSIPKEIWRVIDFIFKYGMDVAKDHLFTTKGNEHTVEYVRECLDTGTLFDLEQLLLEPSEIFATPISSPALANSADEISLDANLLLSSKAEAQAFPRPAAIGRRSAVHSMCEVLLDLLVSQHEPVIPTYLYQRCVQEGYLSFLAAKQVVKHSPPAHLNVFIYIVSFLRELVQAKEPEHRRAEVDRLTGVFAPVTMRPPGMSVADKRQSLGASSTLSSRFDGASVGAAYSNDARQRMFFRHFLEEGNEM